MTKYIVVDCDSPIPGLGDLRSNQDNVNRIIYKLLAADLDPASTNILVGVTREGSAEACSLHIRKAMGYINHKARNTIINNFVVVNSETLTIEAGLDEPRDLQGELVFLTDRTTSRAIFGCKNWWWNEHYKLRNRLEKHERRQKRR